MKLIRHLDKNDLIYILSEYFKVDKKHVILQPFITMEGYGMDEHEVADIKAEIVIE